MKLNAGRLALRVEGDKWTAYYAMPHTMEKALWLGAIRLTLVENPERKKMFIDLMKNVLEELLAQTGHQVSDWDEERAPEHERSGRS
jgi:hypothetical protein